MSEVAAVILAGGRSTRMGQDKASLVLGGRTLLQRAVDAVSVVATEVVVVLRPGAPPPEVEGLTEVRFVEDEAPNEGPLVGIVSGLACAQAPVVLIVACDQPFVRPELLRLLAERAREHIAVVPFVDGLPQPMCSAVRFEALPVLREFVASGSRAANALADLPGALRLERDGWGEADVEGRSFIGVNTPEEFERAKELAQHLD
jgi:molybdopterin-guanine dinucleotide biosynthesis protein A